MLPSSECLTTGFFHKESSGTKNSTLNGSNLHLAPKQFIICHRQLRYLHTGERMLACSHYEDLQVAEGQVHRQIMD